MGMAFEYISFLLPRAECERKQNTQNITFQSYTQDEAWLSCSNSAAKLRSESVPATGNPGEETWGTCLHVIHTVKGFGIVNKAEVAVFLELSCFFDDPEDVGNLISVSSALSKTSLNIWKSMVHVLLKSSLKNFEHHFTSVWDECNCVVVWAFFGIAFLWDW